MSIFWNKKTEADKIVYTRTGAQKRAMYYLIILGLFLLIGIPTLVKNFSLFSNVAHAWPTFSIFVILSGAVIIFFVAIFQTFQNFKILIAKMKKKKVQIVSTEEKDTVIIEK